MYNFLHLLTPGNNNTKTVQQSRKNNTQAIINILLDKHREYRRKELYWVKNSVDKIWVVLGSCSAQLEANSGGNKKRRASSSVVPVGEGSSSSTIVESNSNNLSSSPQSKKKRGIAVEGEKSGDRSAVEKNNPIAIQEAQ